ncbi:ROK family protein [Corynebacterium otitidis]
MPALTAVAPFTRPSTPVSQCFHKLRQTDLASRTDLVAATGLSQPTVTRAVTTLIEAGLVRPRNDKRQIKGRGRPTIPIEMVDQPVVFAGIAVGTSETYFAIYDLRGRTLRDISLDINVAEFDQNSFLEHLAAGLHRITTGLKRPLAHVGVTTSGYVSPDGIVNAPNLGWHDVDFAGRLNYYFSVPVTIAGAVPAILGSEMQHTEPRPKDEPRKRQLALFADDSLSAALSDPEGVRQVDALPAADGGEPGGERPENTLITQGVIERARERGARGETFADVVAEAARQPGVRAVLDERARLLGEISAQLIDEHRAESLVLAGSAFTDDKRARPVFAESVRAALGREIELRLIPTHAEIVTSIARAVALDAPIKDPLAYAAPIPHDLN